MMLSLVRPINTSATLIIAIALLAGCAGMPWAYDHDGDSDGIPDRIDHCPDTPRGARVDYAGCATDSDGDGVPNGLDRCPATPGGHAVDFVGCARDSDCDGVADSSDTCPNTPSGFEVDARGCHNNTSNDNDRDGVPNTQDLCPNTPKGEAIDLRGCEKDVRFEISGVNFDRDSAALNRQAQITVGQISEVLKAAPERHALIEGHTDSRSTATYNYRLGLKRAQAVRQALIGRGINQDRIVVRSLGEGRPRADNRTAQGRASNRRVEIRLLEDLRPLLPDLSECQHENDGDCDGIVNSQDRCPTSPAGLTVGSDGCLPEHQD